MILIRFGKNQRRVIQIKIIPQSVTGFLTTKKDTLDRENDYLKSEVFHSTLLRVNQHELADETIDIAFRGCGMINGGSSKKGTRVVEDLNLATVR